MANAVELWFVSAPPPAAIGLALERFGALHELRDGTLRLVEGDEDPREGVPLHLTEGEEPPDSVRGLLPNAHACLHCSAVLTGSRGFWMVRIAAELQRRLGGVIHVPSSGEAWDDVHAFEHSWPDEHGGHD